MCTPVIVCHDRTMRSGPAAEPFLDEDVSRTLFAEVARLLGTDALRVHEASVAVHLAVSLPPGPLV
ncbi:hypothetical protein [Nigerium massiliense]|uniref:hypothetical protein n=1 Tax=Nigerium massiliense TaxID=1522317 RepID=UPI0011C92D7E|nr:hypothetical protein [Nigerium massiliense]